VKKRLRDAGLLGRVAKKKPYLRLANKKKRLRWPKEHRHWTEELCLENQHPKHSGTFTVFLVNNSSVYLASCLGYCPAER
jgi:hypothetical protein